MSNLLKDKGKMFYFHLIVMFALFFIIGMLPPFGMITEMGMKVLGAFVAIVYGWICIDLFWVSVLGFLLLGMTGLMTPASAFSTGLANSTVQTVLLVGAFAAGLSQLGLGELIVNFILSKKIIVGRPWLLVLAFALLGVIFGICSKAIFGIILLFSILLDLAKKCGYEAKSPAVSFIGCIIVYCCIFLPAGFAPYLPTMLMFGGIFTNSTGVTLPFGKYFVVGLVLSLGILVVMLLVAKYIVRIDMSKFIIDEQTRQNYAAQKNSKTAKVAFSGLVVYILLLVVPQFMDPTIPIVAFVNNVGIIGWTIVYMSVFVIWRNENGEPVLDIAKMFKDVPWVIVMLIMITIPLGNAMGNAEVGVMATLVMYLQPILMNMGITGMYIFVFAFLAVLTQFTHNFVAGAVLIPLFGSIGINMGANPYVLFFLMFTALNASFATPAASMNTGFLFGSDVVDPKQAYLWGWLLILISGILCLLAIPILTSVLAV